MAEVGQLMKPIVAKHFTDADVERARQAAKSYDSDKVAANWDTLFAEARELMEAGDTTSPRALSVARRWKAGIDAFSVDPEMRAKAQSVWQDAMADPEVAPKLPMDPALFAFVGKILQQAR
jgi:hypothetical protein